MYFDDIDCDQDEIFIGFDTALVPNTLATVSELRAGLARWLSYYGRTRRLAGRTPADGYGSIDASGHWGHDPHREITQLAA